MKKNTPRTTLGILEKVNLPAFGIKGILAKVDTGAFTGALHCTDIRVVKSEGEKVLRFRPVNAKHKMFETTDFYERTVVSASGHRSKRYIIPTQLSIHGVVYDTHIGLSDRKELKRLMLIGRSFIRQNNMLVDVRINEASDDEREITVL